MVEDRYYLVQLAESNIAQAAGGEEAVVPRIFHSVVTVAELDNAKLVEDSLRCISGVCELPLCVPTTACVVN